MSEMTKLSTLRLRESAKILAIGGEPSFRRRLSELGLTVAGRVTCYAEAIGGRTAVYQTEGGLIALRKQDADLIQCEKVDGE